MFVRALKYRTCPDASFSVFFGTFQDQKVNTASQNLRGDDGAITQELTTAPSARLSTMQALPQSFVYPVYPEGPKV